MKRLKDEFVSRIAEVIHLSDSEVLEIGCGSGVRSENIARNCKKLTGVDPDQGMVDLAREKNIANAEFGQGYAQKLDFKNQSFDHAIFTLSFHHVPVSEMSTAIEEALRVLKPDGTMVFLEPGTEGSFFEAEILFNAGDGDEQEEKSIAYSTMMDDPRLQLLSEITDDETIIQFNSAEDFTQSMKPKKNLEALDGFLESHNYTLVANRRINIFRRKS